MDEVPAITANPWDEEVDSFDAALMLGVTVNNLRQMVFKKKIAVAGKKGRRATFRREDIEKLKRVPVVEPSHES